MDKIVFVNVLQFAHNIHNVHTTHQPIDFFTAYHNNDLYFYYFFSSLLFDFVQYPMICGSQQTDAHSHFYFFFNFFVFVSFLVPVFTFISIDLILLWYMLNG